MSEWISLFFFVCALSCFTHARRRRKSNFTSLLSRCFPLPIFLICSVRTYTHTRTLFLFFIKMTSMSSMGSQSNKDRSKTASSATVTRLFQKSLRDLITGTFLFLLFVSCRKIEFSFARVCCGSQN